MNHYMYLYGSTVINANCIRSTVNITLEACVRYPLYIVIYCKQVHYTIDSLVWGLLRLAPFIAKNPEKGSKSINASCHKYHDTAMYHYLKVLEA